MAVHHSSSSFTLSRSLDSAVFAAAVGSCLHFSAVTGP